MKYIAAVDGLELPVEILDENHIRFGDDVLEVDLAAISGEPLYSLIVNDESYEGYVYPDDEGWQVLLMGQFYQVTVEDERERNLKVSNQAPVSATAEFVLKAPMPGMVVAVPVEEGQKVEKGEILIVLESMKMQNEIRAPYAGKINGLRIHKGESVEQKQTLLNLVIKKAIPG